MQHKQPLLILKSCHILVLSKIECPFLHLVSFELLLCHLCFSRTTCFPCVYWQAVLAAKRTLQTYFFKTPIYSIWLWEQHVTPSSLHRKNHVSLSGEPLWRAIRSSSFYNTLTRNEKRTWKPSCAWKLDGLSMNLYVACLWIHGRITSTDLLYSTILSPFLISLIPVNL